MDVEANFLASVIDHAGLKEAIDAGVRADYFQELGNQEVWAWLVDFYEQHSVTPGPDVVEHRFPKFVLEDERPEPLGYFIEELRRQRKQQVLIEGLLDVRSSLNDGRIDDAVGTLTESLDRLHLETSKSYDIDLTEGTETWVDEYLEEVKRGTFLKGIPSGFEFVDAVTGGFQPEQLITIIGLPKAGKSISLLWANIAAHQYGSKTMFVTFEMSNDEQRLRHHAFRAGISWNHLRFGTLTPTERRKLQFMLNGMAAQFPMVFIADPSSSMTVSAIASKIVEHQPDIVFIDGTYLMDCDVPGLDQGSPQALTAITRGLKRLAQSRKVPIVNTTQVLPSKYSARAGLTISAIGYTSSFAQDSDVILGWEAVPTTPGAVNVSVVAARNVPPASRRYIIDWDCGSITEEDEETFGEDEEGDYADE